jgi:hypothetical protein
LVRITDFTDVLIVSLPVGAPIILSSIIGLVDFDRIGFFTLCHCDE